MLEKIQFAVLMFASDLKAKRDERGATAVEYGLMVSLIAAAIVASVLALGDQLNALFDSVTSAITTVAP
jgi:pilus assembly protein Flp/PilA